MPFVNFVCQNLVTLFYHFNVLAFHNLDFLYDLGFLLSGPNLFRCSYFFFFRAYILCNFFCR